MVVRQKHVINALAFGKNAEQDTYNYIVSNFIQSPWQSPRVLTKQL